MCIKTLEVPAGGQNKEEAVERQRREVAVLAALALHPNIIRWVQGVLPCSLLLLYNGVVCSANG